MKEKQEMINEINADYIEVLNEIKSGYVADCDDCDDCNDCDVKSICFDFSAIQALNIAIKALHEEREWIPISERLPKQQEKIYWICTDRGYQCECRWTNVNHIWTWLTTDWHWHFADVPQYQKVVAWMPLTEPYKESENKNDKRRRSN